MNVIEILYFFGKKKRHQIRVCPMGKCDFVSFPLSKFTHVSHKTETFHVPILNVIETLQHFLIKTTTATTTTTKMKLA